jgi:hypothetical protein
MGNPWEPSKKTKRESLPLFCLHRIRRTLRQGHGVLGDPLEDLLDSALQLVVMAIHWKDCGFYLT